ncbi:LysE family translocator [Shewanella sp. OPT22]|nr:LysE family translocator [Shewanella sp. OPT22]
MLEAWISLVVTSLLLLGSPGPAPLALAAVGATAGVKKGIPFLMGILSGLVVAITFAAVGLATLFDHYPFAKLVCEVLGAIYILFVAYKIASAPALSNANDVEVPDFKDGFILNLLNPKAYAAFLAVFAQFLLPYTTEVTSYLMTAIGCFFVAVFVDSLWLMAGGVLRPFLSDPKKLRVTRITFAVIMVVMVIYALFFS